MNQREVYDVVERTIQYGETMALHLSEIGALASSISALELLYDWHDNQINQADAMGFDTGWHQQRQQEIRDEQHKILCKACMNDRTCVIVRVDSDVRRPGLWVYQTASGHWSSSPQDALFWARNKETQDRAAKLRAKILPELLVEKKDV